MKLNIQTIIYTEEHKKQTRWNVHPGWASDEALTISAVLQNTALLLSSDLHPSQWWSDTDKHKTATITPVSCWKLFLKARDWHGIHISDLPLVHPHVRISRVLVPKAKFWNIALVRKTVFASHLRVQWAENINILILIYYKIFWHQRQPIPHWTQSRNG